MLRKLPSLVLMALIPVAASALPHTLKYDQVKAGKIWTFQIQNDSGVALKSFVVDLVCNQSSVPFPGEVGRSVHNTYASYVEDASNSFGAPFQEILPGTTRAFPVHEDLSNCRGHIRNAVFADGFGSPAAASFPDHSMNIRQGKDPFSYRLKNSYGVPLEAFIVDVKCDSMPPVSGNIAGRIGGSFGNTMKRMYAWDVWGDPEGSFSEMQPGETREFRSSIALGGLSDCKASLRSALFADGSVLNPRGLRPIYEARRGTYEELQFAYPLLAKAAAGAISMEAVEISLSEHRRKLLDSAVRDNDRYQARLQTLEDFVQELAQPMPITAGAQDHPPSEARMDFPPVDERFDRKKKAGDLAANVQERMNELEPNLKPGKR